MSTLFNDRLPGRAEPGRTSLQTIFFTAAVYLIVSHQQLIRSNLSSWDLVFCVCVREREMERVGGWVCVCVCLTGTDEVGGSIGGDRWRERERADVVAAEALVFFSLGDLVFVLLLQGR